MPVPVHQSVLIIIVCTVCTAAERFLPFIIFRKGTTPASVLYLGKVLPIAIMATLVIYCLRAMTFSAWSGFVPQAIAVAVTALLHLWKSNTLLSVFSGTAIYMCLLQLMST